MKREGSRAAYFVQRIPADIRAKVVGRRLAIPVGDGVKFITPSERSQSIRFSLGANDPATIKILQANIAAHLETVWQALRRDDPVRLTHKQATALAGELYRAWADEDRSRSITVEYVSGEGLKRVYLDQAEREAHWAAVAAMWERIAEGDDPSDLEKPLGLLVDRLLLTKGIHRVDEETRSILLSAFWQALRDAIENRKRNTEGDYSPDPKAQRFPKWEASRPDIPAPQRSVVSILALVEDWWKEAKAAGLKQSTYESYSSTVAKLVAFLGHDDASRVTAKDIVRFKDHRLEMGTSTKTIRDSDLAGLNSVFGWATANHHIASNPADGITVKVQRRRKVRSKGFSDGEACAILQHARNYQPNRENPKLAAAKRWVPWLCAFTGARVGEMLQLRSQDIRQEGKHWIVTVTPEAGPVKTDEAREVVLHRQLVAEGFLAFIEGRTGYFFISPREGELGARKAVKTARNKVTRFVREAVSDPHVDPNHGWRHRFKTIAIEEGIELRVIDAIQGHAPRNVSEEYGDVTIRAIANAMSKMPDITV